MPETFEARIARLFSMSDETWARHANPWSVWTRFTALPVLVVAIWSRQWIGHGAWAATALAIAWIWLNPRLFRKPASTHNWASKAVLGERVWLNRNEVPVPPHHRRLPNILNTVSGLGLLCLVLGLWQLSLWPTALGVTTIYMAKLWFLDRMVWLYDDMKDARPEYASWLYGDTQVGDFKQ